MKVRITHATITCWPARPIKFPNSRFNSTPAPQKNDDYDIKQGKTKFSLLKKDIGTPNGMRIKIKDSCKRKY